MESNVFALRRTELSRKNTFNRVFAAVKSTSGIIETSGDMKEDIIGKWDNARV